VAEHGVAELGHVGEVPHGQLVRAVHLEEEGGRARGEGEGEGGG
jgi:hypothetical protein